MKTKDLIKLLQEADPTGEEHCCIQNADIWSVIREPAYYDGALQIIDRDENEHPVVGRRVRSGYNNKINITPISISDCWDYKGFKVEYTDEADRLRNEKFDIEEKRGEDEIVIRVERATFASWIFMKIQSQKPIPLGWVDRIKQAAEKFYDEHRGPDKDGKMIADRSWPNNSYNDRLETIWDETIRVEWDKYSRIIIEQII